jgi:hypothetical protein
MKLWPAKAFFFGMWPSDTFEFKTPDLEKCKAEEEKIVRGGVVAETVTKNL